MATTKDITTLGAIDAKSAKLLAQSNGTLGYIEGIFNDEGKLQEVAELAKNMVDSGAFQSHVQEYNSTKSSLETTIETLQTLQTKLAEEIEKGIEKAQSTADNNTSEIGEIQNQLEELGKTAAQLDEVKDSIDTKIATAIEELDLDNKIANFMKPGQVNSAIDTKLKEFEEAKNLQVLETISNYIGKLYEIVGSADNFGNTITNIQNRLDALEKQQADTAKAVNNYTAVVKDFITPTEQS